MQQRGGRWWTKGRVALAVAAVFVGIGGLSLLWPLPDLEGGQVLSVRFTSREGVLLREWRPEGRGQPVALADISPQVVAALVAVEDRRFYRHRGIDVPGLARALRDNARARRVVAGGSTLTMQVARALRGEKRRGVLDKIAEMHLALRLESHLEKDEILALWLNRVSFGNRAHGIEAASRLYFGKSARDLTLAEAAFLVGLPQSPSRYNPYRYRSRADARWRRVLAAMQETGALPAARRAEIEAAPLRLVAAAGVFHAPHFTERLIAEGLASGAVEVRTTLSADLQATAEALVRTHLYRLRTAGVGNAAALVLDNATGDVLAYVGSRDFFDRQAQGQNDGVQMLRQPGSALKPFTYAAALGTRRYTPATILPDVELALPEAGGAFRPENYDRRFHGPVPLAEALASSYNVPAVVLARELGPALLLEGYRAAGFSMLDRPADVYGVGLTLGSGEVTLEALGYAYAGLARGGLRPAPRRVAWTRTAAGDTLAPLTALPVPMGIEPGIAFLLADILSDPEARAGGFGRGGPLELPFPVAVKTGTSKDYRDNWAVGFTPRHTVAVWVGNFSGAPMHGVSGVSGAAPLFRALVLALGPGGDFAVPPDAVEAAVCPHSGHRAAHACPGTRRVWMLAETVPADTCTVHRLVGIDRRTGLLADAATPVGARETRRFLVYGSEYRSWMREQGLDLPPTVSQTTLAAQTGASRFSDRLAVTYPAAGTHFLRDPHLRTGFQRVALRARAEDGLLDLRWRVNGRDAGAGLALDWPLQPGRHTFSLTAVTPDGQRLQSRPVAVMVE